MPFCGSLVWLNILSKIYMCCSRQQSRIPFSEFTTIHQPVLQLWGCFQCFGVWDKASMSILVMCFGGHVGSFLLGVYLGVALLGHSITLIFREIAKPFSTADKLFYFHQQYTGFQFFHIFATITKRVSGLF